ncbi:MAG TPA: tol-pal system protein YbgF [Anaerolineales bacterium]|nr:tol-pal system protein YbgF [Anaerolineales bacterium]
MFVPLLLFPLTKEETPARIRAARRFWIVLVISVLSFFPQIVAASNVQDTSRHLYDRVMEEFKQGDYEAALAGFRFFIALHPNAALTANAQYWIGECQYRLGRYEEALRSFSSVGSYDPVSQKRPASAFKVGQAYSMLGDYYRARLAFEEVIDQYPGGAEAQLARKAIQGIIPKIESKLPHPMKQISNMTAR